MKYIVLLEDNPTADPNIRSTHMEAHIQFLESNNAAIEAAGPLFENDDAGAGGIWIVTADSESSVRALVEQDPFWPTGLRASIRVLKWTQVFANGQRLVNT